MKKHLTAAALAFSLAIPAFAAQSASKTTTKPDKVEKKSKSDDSERRTWPFYLVSIYGVNDTNFPELKKALLDTKNISDVTKAEPNKYLITAKDPSKPVYYKELKDATAKVKGTTLTGVKGTEDADAEPEKETPKKPVAPKPNKPGKSEKSEDSKKTDDKSRKAWPQYDVGITGVTKKNWPDLKKAILAVDNVEEFAMTEPDNFRITAKDPKKPIWYGKVKEAVAQVDGLKLGGMTGSEKE